MSQEWTVEYNRGGSNGPNYLIKRNDRFVAILYQDSESYEDFEALLEKITSR